MGIKFKGNRTPADDARIAKDTVAIKKDIQSKMNKANKRIKRLEKNGLHHTGAYKKHVAGKGSFGVKDKNYNQLLAEQARINKFLGSQTSTVRGVKTHNKQMLRTLGLKNTKANRKYMEENSAKVWEVIHKVEELQRLNSLSGEVLSSDQISEKVGRKIEGKEINVDDVDGSIENVIDSLGKNADLALKNTKAAAEAAEIGELAEIGRFVKLIGII